MGEDGRKWGQSGNHSGHQAGLRSQGKGRETKQVIALL